MDLSIPSFWLGLAAGVLIGLVLELVLRIVHTWIRSVSSGAPVPLGYLIGMRLRGTPSQLIVDAHSALAKRDRPTTIDVVETTYLAHRSEVRSEQDLVRLLLEPRVDPSHP